MQNSGIIALLINRTRANTVLFFSALKGGVRDVVDSAWSCLFEQLVSLFSPTSSIIIIILYQNWWEILRDFFPNTVVHHRCTQIPGIKYKSWIFSNHFRVSMLVHMNAIYPLSAGGWEMRLIILYIIHHGMNQPAFTRWLFGRGRTVTCLQA